MCLTSVPTSLSAKFFAFLTVCLLREHELKSELTYLYLVSVSKIHGIDPDAINVRPVQAAGVPDAEATNSLKDLGVVPGYGHVVEKDVALGTSAYGDNLYADIVHPTASGAFNLVEFDQSGTVWSL